MGLSWHAKCNEADNNDKYKVSSVAIYRFWLCFTVLGVMTPCFLHAFPQAIDSIHQVGLYCLALVPANTLPKTHLGGIHVSETKQRFLEGFLHPCNILLCPHTCVTNLPKPRQKQPGTLDLHLNQNLKNGLTFFFVNMMRGINFKQQVNWENLKNIGF